MIQKSLISIICLFIINMTAHSQGNWELLIPSGTSNQMASLHFIDELTGWSVGKHGTITRTTDGGITWEIVEIDLLTDLTDVYFPGESVGYIVGEDGLILKTGNAGVTWIKLDNSFSNNLHRVKFRNEETGWIIGEKGLILHTTDGGINWTQQTSGSRYDLTGIDIIDGQNVCIAGYNNVLLLTEDDGANWQMIEAGFYSQKKRFHYTDIYFVNSNSGWACGIFMDLYYGYNEGFIAKTYDGGKQWEIMEVNEAAFSDFDTFGMLGGGIYFLQQIYFKDDLTTGLCLISKDEEIAGNIPLFTSNEGRSWNVFIEGANEMTPCKGRFQFLTDSRVIATGFRGDVRFSNDSGRNWHFNNNDKRFWDGFQIGNDNKLHAIQRKPIRDNIYEVEYKHLISQDKGATWNEVISTIHYLDGTEENIQKIAVMNMHNLGQFTLTSISQLFTCYLRNISDTTWSVLYSQDMGINYYELRNDVQTRMDFLTPDTLIFTYITQIAMGDEANIPALKSRYSYDGGVTIISNVFPDVWNDITPSALYTPKVNDSYYFNGHTGFIAGDDGNIVKTEDTGQSWTNIYSGVVEDLVDVEFINRETGFVVGDFGRILKTDDGGATWRKTDSGTQEDIYTIAFLNETQGWVGTESGMRYTTDGGETWHGVPLRYQHGAVHNIKFDSEGNGYAYTLCSNTNNNTFAREYSGSYVLLQRMQGSAVDVNDHYDSNQSIPAQIHLLPNYPNPFNATTQIKYQIPEAGSVSIKIINIQGQLVRTLVNELKPSGQYTVMWDGRTDSGIQVSSGVFIYQLAWNDQVENRKLLLVK